MSLFKYNLGDEVKDRITGLKGIIIARTEWFNKCIRYVVQPVKLEDGKRVEEAAFDEDQIVIVTADKVPPPSKIRTGGPQNDKILSRGKL